MNLNKNSINILQNFIKKCNYIYKNFPQILYNNQSINYNDINIFDIKNKINIKQNNNKNNKIRENIIGAIINKQIPNNYYKYSLRWKYLNDEINNYIVLLSNTKNITINSYKCIHKASRNNHYDLKIIINDIIDFNVEFKFNAINITQTPQYVSPMKPSQYLEFNYEEYYYDNYLYKLSDKFNIKIPDRNIYLNNIHSNKPECISEYQNKYYNGCKTSSKYSGIQNDIQFYEYSKQLSKNSISKFIENTELKVNILTNYLKTSQENKYYMLFKNNKFNIQVIDMNNYNIISYIKKPKLSKYIATTMNGTKINILLRWKNGNGIAYPAFQIS